MLYNLKGRIASAHPFTLDKTLSVEGAAADAKATAEAIEKAKNDAAEYADLHSKNEANPHKVTKKQVGLDKVDNTSDSEKPVSTAQAEAIQKVADKVTQVNRDKAETKPYFGILLATGWTEESPFVQEIIVDGILEEDDPFVDVNLSDVDDVLSVIEAWGMVGRCTASADNTITVYCYQEKPSVDIPLKFKVVR